jgi:lysozyme family protein
MGKGFGIAALIVAIIAVFMPMPVWLYVAWVALLLAAVAGLAGDRVFAISVPVLTAANTAVFSPLTLYALTTSKDLHGLLTVHIIAMIVPVAAIVLNASGKLTFDKRSLASATADASQFLSNTLAKANSAPKGGDVGEETWAAIKECGDIELFEEFVARFPGHPRTIMARLQLKELRERARKAASPAGPDAEAEVPEPKPSTAPAQAPSESAPVLEDEEDDAAQLSSKSKTAVALAEPISSPPPGDLPGPKLGELAPALAVFCVIAAGVVGYWFWNQEQERQRATDNAIAQQKGVLEEASRQREAASEAQRRWRESQAQAEKAAPAPQPEPEPEGEEEAAQTVGFTVVNNTSGTVNVAFFDRDSHAHVDPPFDRSYILNGNSTQTYRVSCTAGQNICYGATMPGGNMMPFWGAGRDGKQPCTGCCLACPAAGALVKTLNYSDSRRPNPTITWKITDNTTKPLSVTLFSKTRFQFGWPAWDRNWSTKGGENVYTVNCVEGEQICFGAWITNNIQGPYWGVGPYAKFGCTNCCGVCDGGTYSASLGD